MYSRVHATNPLTLLNMRVAQGAFGGVPADQVNAWRAVVESIEAEVYNDNKFGCAPEGVKRRLEQVQALIKQATDLRQLFADAMRCDDWNGASSPGGDCNAWLSRKSLDSGDKQNMTDWLARLDGALAALRFKELATKVRLGA
jgi:hypothetical protein